MPPTCLCAGGSGSSWALWLAWSGLLWRGGHLLPMLRRYHGVAILELAVKYVAHPDGWPKS